MAVTWKKLAYSTDVDAKQTIAHSHTGTTDSPKLAQANTHESADTDAATGSLHHTIGATATTAAAGNHTHAAGATDIIQAQRSWFL